jgi:putative DNA primase/helicase
MTDQSWKANLACTFDKDGNPKGPKPSVENAFVCLTQSPDWKGTLVYDAFRDRVIFTRRAPWAHEAGNVDHAYWTDSDTHRLGVWLERELGVAVSREKCEAALSLAVETQARHVVREYLEAETWDGVSRVDLLFSKYFGAEATPYVRSVSIAFCIGSVARVMRPGCQLDTLPILEGEQGIGKSSGVRVLAGEWFSDTTIDFGTKDSYQQLWGVWIYELSELDALNRRDVARVKAFISAPSDRYRPSYGRRQIDAPRQVSFIGTTNADAYLSDDTGARRFLPVRCGTIDLEGLKGDRAQIWAEALFRFKAGEAWHLTGIAAQAAAEEQEARRIADPWETSIVDWLDGRTDPNRPVTTSEVLRGIGFEKSTDHDKFRSMRVAGVLRRCGWTRRRLRTEGGRSYLYHSPKEPVTPAWVGDLVAAPVPPPTPTPTPAAADNCFSDLLEPE